MTTTPADRLRERIRRQGTISFSVFMEEALYGEEGYYAREELPIGPDGDFVTGSSHAPLFGEATAAVLSRLDRVLGRPADYLEVGYGSAAHLAAVMAAAGAQERRWLAVERVSRPLPDGVTGYSALDEIEEGSVSGLVFSYELFDALPVRRWIRRADRLRELGVAWNEGRFEWAERSPESTPDEVPTTSLGDLLEEGQVADLADWGALYRSIAARVDQGLVITCDYGFERERLFDARVRRNGTLACYRKQRVHRDPFVDVGRQDLTAHVDFTALMEAGEEAGCRSVALTRQAAWLAAAGLLDGLQNRPAEDRLAALTLLDLDGMGEEIRVLIQSKGLDPWTLIDRSLLARDAPRRS